MTRTFPERVDVAIVGSGPCGAAVARVLSERRPDLRVATFEAGPLLADPPGEHVKNLPDTARERAQRWSEGGGRAGRPGTHLVPGAEAMPGAAMSTNVGGMGAHWTAACPRPGGGERIPFLPDLDGDLDEAERLLGVAEFPDAPYAAQIRERLGAAFDTGRSEDRRVRAMPLAARRGTDGRLRWSGADVVFGEPTRRNPRHALFPDAPVTRVLVDGDRVRGLLVRDLRDGGEHRIRARRVVVAADALRTPRLLWASGVRPEALGRHLNDQPQVIFAVRLRDVRAEEGTPGRSGVSWVPFTDEQPFHGQVMQLDASPVPLDDTPAPGSVVGLGWFCAKEIRADDRVTFGEERDELGMPAMRIHYGLTDRDRATIEAAGKAVRAAAEALGEPLDDDPIVLEPGSSLHYQGTVRMGRADDGTSVCDEHGEVWGVGGLHIAGNGVIPTATACNPTLTSVALAARTARHLADDLHP
ncbi:GMC oxidoreductase [Saccharopolyspora flava]|uniref:Choline dehydrogenase n=1 Tax=Saccharopolyspora flava TaxID=95161 RepID=A0A1I6V2T2_9PSEU|nr:GMC oxidoreductase [Saccharopolyspora flava]SFT07867.1 Choline dehydrogenase [Saccharopolyspora flava]